MKNELAGRESAVRAELLSAKSQMSADTFLLAPDIYFAAAVLLNDSLKIGNGDRTTIINTIKKQAHKCLAIKDKLILLQKVKFLGMKMFKDNFQKLPLADLTISRKEMYHLWLTLVRQKKVLSNADYIEAFPQLRVQAELWFECVDEEGRATIDPDKMEEYIKKRDKERRLQKQLAKAQKGKAKKF